METDIIMQDVKALTNAARSFFNEGNKIECIRRLTDLRTYLNDHVPETAPPPLEPPKEVTP